MKLSPAQQKVVDRMRDGWELAHDGGIEGRIWMQEGGAGKGGQTVTVSIATFARLLDEGAIVAGSRGPGLSRIYTLKVSS